LAAHFFTSSSSHTKIFGIILWRYLLLPLNRWNKSIVSLPEFFLVISVALFSYLILSHYSDDVVQVFLSSFDVIYLEGRFSRVQNHTPARYKYRDLWAFGERFIQGIY